MSSTALRSSSFWPANPPSDWTSTSQSSITVSAPAGIVDGDILFAVVGVGGTTATITAPAGWTQEEARTSGGTGSAKVWIFSKIASSESGDYTFSFSVPQWAPVAFIGCWDSSQLTGTPSFDVDYSTGQPASSDTVPNTYTLADVANALTQELGVFAIFYNSGNTATSPVVDTPAAGVVDLGYTDNYKGSVGSGDSGSHDGLQMYEQYETGGWPEQEFTAAGGFGHAYFRIRTGLEATFTVESDEGGDTGCDESWTVLHGSTGGGGGGADLSDSTPATVGIDSGATAGASDEASRADHKHQIATTDAPSGAQVSIDANPSAAASGAAARAAHGHRVNTSSATPAAVATSGSAGTSTTAPSRGDHAHPHEAAHIVHDTIWAAKGDLMAATANDAAAVVTVGTDGQVLTADSSQASGVKWNPAGGGRAYAYFTKVNEGETL